MVKPEGGIPTLNKKGTLKNTQKMIISLWETTNNWDCSQAFYTSSLNCLQYAKKAVSHQKLEGLGMRLPISLFGVSMVVGMLIDSQVSVTISLPEYSSKSLRK